MSTSDGYEPTQYHEQSIENPSHTTDVLMSKLTQKVIPNELKEVMGNIETSVKSSDQLIQSTLETAKHLIDESSKHINEHGFSTQESAKTTPEKPTEAQEMHPASESSLASSQTPNTNAGDISSSISASLEQMTQSLKQSGQALIEQSEQSIASGHHAVVSSIHHTQHIINQGISVQNAAMQQVMAAKQHLLSAQQQQQQPQPQPQSTQATTQANNPTDQPPPTQPQT